MGTLVERLPSCFHYFLRLSGFLDLSGKVSLITFKFSSLDYSTIFCNSNVQQFIFLVSLECREIITVKTVKLYKKLFFFIKSLKSKKRKLAVTLFHYIIREIWLGNSKKFICIDQSRFYIFSHPREFKNV